jgi:predicted RNA-binding protein YlxR (DUF448 family)
MTKSKSKYPPQRTCIACRLVKEKKALIRIVCTEDGVAEVDALGKKPGRGAYLCSNKICWELALKKNRLEYALRTKLNESNRQTLVEYSQNLLEEN